MKRTLVVLGLALLLISLAIPVAAQVGPRVTINASANNDASDAFGFNPDVQITVNGAEAADTEGGESVHSCAVPSNAGNYSVWFTSYLMPGTVTLNTNGSTFTTAGGPSTDTVVSLYRFVDDSDDGLNSFAELVPVACNDGVGIVGNISNLPITLGATYYVQVSAVSSVTATGASTIVLNADYTAANPAKYDEPGSAKKMKLPNLPSMTNISSATLSLTEPVDPMAIYGLTNTVWAKFTLTSTRVVGFQNFYYNAGTLFFSLFTKSGVNYLPATGTILSFPNIMLATLNPGTYYLRIGIAGEPAGTSSTFITYTGIAYLMPAAYDFSVGLTEGTPSAAPNSTGWKIKKAVTGPGGIDEITCDISNDCYFQFVSMGAAENTSLKANIVLKDVKLKKGDVIRFQPSLSDVTGQPNFKATLVLTNAAGAKQTYSFTVTDGLNPEPNLTATVAAGFTPIKATLTFKNLDTDAGDIVEIDGVIVAALRVGEGLRGTIDIPLLGSVPAGWAPQEPLALPTPK